jgi:hypothetical protein
MEQRYCTDDLTECMDCINADEVIVSRGEVKSVHCHVLLGELVRVSWKVNKCKYKDTRNEPQET